MATSPSHKLGEQIGDFFEAAIVQYLTPIVSKEGYYLDYRHPRPARNMQHEVIGIDEQGNKHKLDIVVEKGGSETQIGTPKAFIEMAWRRYKKHSKNKVQEIAGAIRPLVGTYAKEMPFYSAVLAGEFTDSSIRQLESQGFYVLYFTYGEISDLFDTANISIRWEENTSEDELQELVNKFEELNSEDYSNLQQKFYCMYSTRLQKLADALCEALSVFVSEILVIPIHGNTRMLRTITDAVNFVLNYNEQSQEPMLRYEITIKYSNGDEYTMKCEDKRKAIQFLNQYN